MEQSHYISVPVLHTQLRPDAVFPDALRLCPGLPQMAEHGYISLPWPFSPAQAQAYLRDIEQASVAGLSMESVRAASLEARKTANIAREGRDVRVALGLETADESAELARWRMHAQQVLIMIWSQEERLLEVEALQHSAAAASVRLQSLLGEDAGANTDAPPVFGGADVQFLPDWRTVLEHAAVFLPPQAVLVSADPRVTGSLLETDLFKADARGASAWWRGRIPLWRVLGHGGPLAGRPWLETERSFILCHEDTTEHA